MALTSGCCEPQVEVRYKDRNITVKVPVACEIKKVDCIYKGNNIEVIAGMHTCILNYKKAVKDCQHD